MKYVLSCPPCSTIDEFVSVLTNQINEYYKETLTNLPLPQIKLEVGSKFNRIYVNNTIWGFVARKDGSLKGRPYRRGDLLKPASYSAPAPISRGNVIEGCTYDVYGPVYLKR